VAAAYTNLNPMYTSSPYAPAAENIYMTPPVHSSNFYPVSENIFHQYRLQGVNSYYPEYHHASAQASYVNGFIPYDSYQLQPKEEKWQDNSKYYTSSDLAGRGVTVYSGYGSPTPSQLSQSTHKTPKTSPPLMDVASCSSGGQSPVTSANSVPLNPTPNRNNTNTPNSSNTTTNGGSSTPNGLMSITPKVENSPPQQPQPYEAPGRQTVLMWGASGSNSNSGNPSSQTSGSGRSPSTQSHLDEQTPHLKWNGSSGGGKDLVSVSGVHVYPLHQHHPQDADPSMYSQVPQYLAHHHHHHGGHLDQQIGHNPAGHHPTASIGNNNCEVWSPSRTFDTSFTSSASYSQYFTYHHAQHANTQ
jgi:hypothetical protein